MSTHDEARTALARVLPTIDLRYSDGSGFGPGLDGAMFEDHEADHWADAILAALSPADKLAIAGITEERLAHVLMEYDAGRIVVEPEPGMAVPPGGKPTRFHRAWADAILAALQADPDAARAVVALLGGEPVERLHVHVAGKDDGLDRCDECGHDLRALCHVRIPPCVADGSHSDDLSHEAELANRTGRHAAPQEAARTALALAMYDANTSHGGYECCAPPTHADAAAILTAILAALQADPDAARAVVALLGGEAGERTQEEDDAILSYLDSLKAAPQDDREAEPGLRELAEKLNEALGSGQWGRKGALPFGGPIDQAHEALDIWLSNHPARPQAPESPTDG